MRYIIIVLISAFVGGLAATYVPRTGPTEESRIAEYYATENAVLVSPHSVRKHMGEEGMILVDLRSAEEYATAHIVGALSIPAYMTPDVSDYGATERIVRSFSELKASNPDADIVVYCYSSPCMTGRKIGLMLAENGIYVKHLGIGWNEWRYLWDMWNHDGETKVDPALYVATGTDPGIFRGPEKESGCPATGGAEC